MATTTANAAAFTVKKNHHCEGCGVPTSDDYPCGPCQKAANPNAARIAAQNAAAPVDADDLLSDIDDAEIAALLGA